MLYDPQCPKNICKLLAVVIDDFIDEPTRQALLDFLLHGAPSSTPGCAANGICQGSMQGGRAGATQGQGAAADAAPAGAAAAAAGKPGLQQDDGPQLPPGRWERRTADMAGGAPTWGVKQHVLAELAAGSLPAMQVSERASCACCCAAASMLAVRRLHDQGWVKCAAKAFATHRGRCALPPKRLQ